MHMQSLRQRCQSKLPSTGTLSISVPCSWALLCSESVLLPAHFPIFGPQLGLEPGTHQLPAQYCVLWMLEFYKHLLCLFNQSSTSSLKRIHLQYNSILFSFFRSDMSFLEQIHVFCEYTLHVKENMFDFVRAEAGMEKYHLTWTT